MKSSLVSVRHRPFGSALISFRSGLLLLLFIIAATLIAGCGPAVRYPSSSDRLPDTQQPQEEYRPVTGKGNALFLKAQAAQQTGKYAEAEMLLERALRIEPQNPHYWYAMAVSKYGQAQYPQTIQLCLKAESLAGNQQQILGKSRSLLRKAQAAMANR